jgi:soluble lytic murein transglycosylase
MGAATNHPLLWLSGHGTDLERRSRRELLFLALESLSRDDPDAAVDKLGTLALPEADARYALGRIALRAARLHHPSALEWFRAAGAELTDDQLGWKVRAALRRGAWADVFAAVSAMSEKTASEPAWRYWMARALREQGRLVQANVLLAALSREPNFYGQLALEELGAVASAPAPAWKPDDADISDIRHVPGIARALMLNAIGMGLEANAEWDWSTRNFDDRRLLAAATLALREGWVDRAIRTADRTREIHDFELRYPALYRDEARREARKTGLDEAWVFGVIRQESRFVPHARSSAGAQGLMQIMPATARWIARQLGFRSRDAKAMHEPGRNIAYGTYYLRYVLDRLDHHPVLATAAYNAGPRRAKRWQADRPLEGAVYTETIPFVETRDYVKKVMLNAVRYASRFGQPEATLGERLGMIPARAGAPPTDSGAVDLAQ